MEDIQSMLEADNQRSSYESMTKRRRKAYRWIYGSALKLRLKAWSPAHLPAYCWILDNGKIYSTDAHSVWLIYAPTQNSRSSSREVMYQLAFLNWRDRPIESAGLLSRLLQ